MVFSRTHLLFFLRNLRRHKSFTFLNLLGLVVGMASFIYMLGYVQYERSFDSHAQYADQVYRIASQKIQDGDPQLAKSSASVALAPHLRETQPMLESVTRVHMIDSRRLIIRVKDDLGNERTFMETKGYHAEGEYFDIFPSQLIQGDPATALVNPNSIVLTESLAEKYFGTENPIGKTVTMTDLFEMEYQITGIAPDPPATTHFRYDFLVSFSTFEKQRPTWRWTSWDWDYFHTYIKVKPDADIDQLAANINASVADAGKEVFEGRGYSMLFTLQPLMDIHLYSNLGREFAPGGNGALLVYIEVIAFFVLALAWINYINLSTARATIRAKEIAIRKVTGSNRGALLGQLLSESFLMNLIALVFTLGLLALVAPLMEPLTDFGFSLSQLLNPKLLVLITGVFIVGSIGSGIYPALVLTRFQPVKVLKGSFANSKEGLFLRKFLVVFQFMVAILLLAGTLTVYRQINFLRDRDLGVNIDQVLITSMPNLRDESFWPDYDRFKNRLLQSADFTYITSTNDIPGNFLNRVELIKRPEQPESEAKINKLFWIDFDFVELFDLELVAGRNFTEERPADHREGVFFNESAIRQLGFSSPEEAIDKHIDWIHPGGLVEPYRIIGVLNDFDQEALGGTEPMVFIMNRPQIEWWDTYYISIGLVTSDLEGAIETIRETHQDVYPNDSFDYFFLDEHFNRQYASDQRFGKIFGLFALMGILISNLGLFGLTAFIVLQRKKEMSIRRVLGARLSSIVQLISMQFVFQLALAISIAIPVAYFGLDQWLDKFARRMPLSLDIFLYPVAAIGAIALVTIVYQALSATRVNPTENLRE